METTIIREVQINYKTPKKVPEALLKVALSVKLFRKLLPNNSQEHFLVVYVNNALTPIGYSSLFSGGHSSCMIEPKLILQRALILGSRGIMICHNHPSGNAEPSYEDGVTTYRIKEMCKALDMQLFDHIILTDAAYYSYSEQDKL